MTKIVCKNLGKPTIEVLSSIGEDMTPLEEVEFMARRQNGKSSKIQRNLPYPKLDMKALEDFIDRLQNSDKYKEFNRERERQYEVCKEMGLLEQIEPSNKMVLDSEELRKLRQAEERVNTYLERMKELGIFYIAGVDPYEPKGHNDFKHVLIHKGDCSTNIPKGCYKLEQHKTKKEPVIKRGLYRIKKLFGNA